MALGLSVTFEALGNMVVGCAVSTTSTVGGVLLGNGVGLPGETLKLSVSFEALGLAVTGTKVGRATSCFKLLGNRVGFPGVTLGLAVISDTLGDRAERKSVV